MAPTGKLGYLIGTVVAAALAAAGGTVAGSAKVDRIVDDVAAIRSDVRMLKCVGGFPGDCPGQAKASAK